MPYRWSSISFVLRQMVRLVPGPQDDLQGIHPPSHLVGTGIRKWPTALPVPLSYGVYILREIVAAFEQGRDKSLHKARPRLAKRFEKLLAQASRIQQLRVNSLATLLFQLYVGY
jgi:hypothetical protein